MERDLGLGDKQGKNERKEGGREGGRDAGGRDAGGTEGRNVSSFTSDKHICMSSL